MPARLLVACILSGSTYEGCRCGDTVDVRCAAKLTRVMTPIRTMQQAFALRVTQFAYV